MPSCVGEAFSSESWISIESETLSARINPLGAELSSLQDGDGRELMTDADPAFWSGRAPLLFPIVGQLRDNQYRFNDTIYKLEKHGFARRQKFELIEQGQHHALFSLCANDLTRAQYPFEFRLEMAFEVAGDSLLMTATITNEDDKPMPFSFGYHPAFAWPLPYGRDIHDHRIIFEKREPAPIRRLEMKSGLVKDERQDSPVKGRVFSPVHADFEDDAIIWDDLQSRSLTWGAAGDPMLQIDFPDTPMLGVWQKSGARYLCIEPWAGIADPVGFDGDFVGKPGLLMLDIGAQRSFRMKIRLKES
ncbi:aldose 1-epimerase family protein [Parasphingorhabdus sp.]|uniref:aldose 1-epimerase family protein n=1 Tax=Parasphingorhabdus sp. TaxID=2709688 RepID=UPI003A9404FA